MKQERYSHEAEVSTLGCLFVSVKALVSVRMLLSPEMFYIPAHAVIYRACLGLSELGHAVDLVTVRNYLQDMPRNAEGVDMLAFVGGIDYLIQCAEAVPSAANALDYAQIVADHWIVRQTVKNLARVQDELSTRGIQAMPSALDSMREITARAVVAPVQHLTFAEVLAAEPVAGVPF